MGSYTYFMSNKIIFSGYAMYYGSYKRAITVYDLWQQKDAVIQRYQNDGEFTNLRFGLNGVGRFLRNSLIFQVGIGYEHVKSTGYYTSTQNPILLAVNGQYYFGEFNLTASYSTRRAAMDEFSGVYSKGRNQYNIGIGWSHKAWNLRFTASNFLRYSYIASDNSLVTPVYEYHSVNYNSASHASVGISVTYTLGYGRKIQQGNEVKAQQGPESAIM